MNPYDTYYNCKSAKRRDLEFQPRVKGEMIEFVCTDYATREKRTRVLIDPDDISSIKEHYDLDQYKNDCWCKVVIKGSGSSYEVLSSYDTLSDLIVSVKSGKRGK